MKTLKSVYTLLICFIFLILLAGCKKDGSGDAGVHVPVNDVSFEELMAKYGPKDKSEAEIKELIKSIKWTVEKEMESLASKDAKKGGTLTVGSSNYPATLRIVGEATTAFNSYYLESLCYETLLGLHPVTMEFSAGLADKWYIADDEQTYFFHIDKNAAWTDGNPVTAFDYVATYDLLMSDDIKDPFQKDYWGKYERPAALAPNIIMIKSKEKVWRAFMSAAISLTVMPEHIIGRISAEEYMKQYQDKLTVTSGPYMLDKAERNQYIVLKRNEKWWANYDPENRYAYNFDNIKFMFFTDRNIIRESLKKGEIDVFTVGISQKWHQEFIPEKYETIELNHLVRQRIYNHMPNGLYGIGFNIRKPPFDDIRVRKALAHLVNREKMMEKLFFNEYRLSDSIYPNTPYENKDNVKVRYNPDKAIELLEEAGWSQDSLNDEGYLVKDGEVFELDLNIYNPSDTRVQNLYQEELAAVGIKLNLKNVTWAAHVKDIDERNFKLISIGYTGLLFPNPESSLHSKFADLKNTNNLWGFKNKRVDEICEEYNFEFDVNKRIELIREMDKIVMDAHITAHYWYPDNLRLLYWNKFGTPEFVISRFAQSAGPSIIAYWWYDEEKDKALQEAIKNKTKLPGYPGEVDYWKKYK